MVRVAGCCRGGRELLERVEVELDVEGVREGAAARGHGARRG